MSDIVERLRHWEHTGSPASKLLEDDLMEAADALEELQAEVERLRAELMDMTKHSFLANYRNAAVEEAAQRAEEYDGVGSIAAAIRALKE